MRALLAFSDSTNMMALCEALAETEVDMQLCSTLSDVRACLGQEKIDLVFCQAQLADGTFRGLLRFVDTLETNTAVVVCTDSPDKGTYLDAMTLGAFDYLALPFRESEVKWIVGNASRRSTLHQHSLRTRAARESALSPA